MHTMKIRITIYLFIVSPLIGIVVKFILIQDEIYMYTRVSSEAVSKLS